jgi:hypothetical protein
MARTSNTQALLDAVRRWMAEMYPGECCVEVRLKLAHGGRVVLPVPPGVVKVETTPAKPRQ